MVTTTEFLAKVKSAALVPTHQITYQNPDILSFANEELDILIVPKIMSFREEFFVTKLEIPIVPGVDTLQIPERAVGRTIREIKVMPTDDTRPYSLSKETITREFGLSTKPGCPLYHLFEGDVIKINPVPDRAFGVYQLWYEIRPSRLVESANVGIITAISDSTVTVQQNLNKAITTGSVVDIVKARAGYASAYHDLSVATISTGIGPKVLSLTGFSPSNPITGVSIGDHLSLAFTSDIIQLPDEAVAVLIQATALRMLTGQGQEEQRRACKELLDRNMLAMVEAMTPRNEASSFKIRPVYPSFGPGRRLGFFR